MKKRGIVSVIFVLIFLVSCQFQPRPDSPLDTVAALKQIQSGTLGVETKTLPNFPPTMIYDQDELITIIEVKNRGSHDLQAADCFIRIEGLDPDIVGGEFHTPRSCAENMDTLEGKKIYNLEGGQNQVEFVADNVQLPFGVPDYSPNLNIKTCYNYHVTATPQVCIDPLLYQITQNQKICTPQNVGLSGGQGGPVGVSYVDVEMTTGKAIFSININNFGSGMVLSPYTDLQACSDASIDRTEYNKVVYTVQLSGGSVVDCKPRDGIVRLNNGQGKILCTFDIAGTAAYETPLIIDLDYGYTQSQRLPIKIIKTPE